ncbi:hypothetical protein LTR17_025746 [Elasticomyces elasticus]|nr:hypothetical protein LTR17_025746 [Elasticomyces elasticus]
MSSNYTIITPAGVAIYTNHAPSVAPVSITADALNLTGGFTLYLPITAYNLPAPLNIATLVRRLDPDATSPFPSNTAPVFIDDGSRAISMINMDLSPSLNLTTGHTLFIPVTSSLSSVVNVASLTTLLPLIAVAPVYATTTSTASQGNTAKSIGSAESTSQMTSPSVLPNSATSTSATDGGQPSAGTPETTFTSSVNNTSAPVTSSTTASQTSPPSNNQPNITTGALAGGVVGGIVVGLLIGSLLWFCCFRKKPTGTKSTSRDPGHRKPIPMVDLNEKSPQSVVVPVAATSWEKHLPHDKNERAVAGAFRSLFDQVQMHIDGYYVPKGGKPSSKAVESLQGLCFDELPKALLRTKDAMPILNGILARWIVHHVSLRSAAESSLLPLEYAKVAEKNEWHMESAERHSIASAESRNAFPQAFSQWRVLTSFLSPDPATDRKFRAELDVKINVAVKTITEAFAPWENHGQNNANLGESLRGILHHASEAGILLFTQRSTYMFDWASSHQAVDTIVVTPAFLKRLDESGTPVRPSPAPLIEATRSKI